MCFVKLFLLENQVTKMVRKYINTTVNIKTMSIHSTISLSYVYSLEPACEKSFKTRTFYKYVMTYNILLLFTIISYAFFIQKKIYFYTFF